MRCHHPGRVRRHHWALDQCRQARFADSGCFDRVRANNIDYCSSPGTWSGDSGLDDLRGVVTMSLDWESDSVVHAQPHDERSATYVEPRPSP